MSLMPKQYVARATLHKGVRGQFFHTRICAIEKGGVRIMNTATLALLGIAFMAMSSGRGTHVCAGHQAIAVEVTMQREERRESRMCLARSARADICRREVRRIDRDFAYKWPMLFLYLDAKQENRSLTIGYIVELRAQLANISKECATRQRLQKIIRAIDMQFVMFILRLQGHEVAPTLAM